jgi:hypothetical protein
MVVLDRSGSMESVRDATIAGFNKFIEEQAKLPGARFSMSQFDTDSIDDLYLDADPGTVKPLTHATYQPRAGTPLYDAVAKGIIALESRKPKGKVIFAIVTDGEENSSREYNQRAVFDMVTAKRAEGWQFVFMGAAMDAYGVGASLGVAAASTYGYAGTGASMDGAFANLSNSSSMFRSGQIADVAMPDVDTVDPSYVPGQAPDSGWVFTPGTAPRSTTEPLPVHTLEPTK